MKAIKEDEPEHWLNNYGDLLYRYALARVHDEGNAEDLVQETLLAGFMAYDDFSGNAKISTWLVGILKYKIIDLYRKTKRERVSLDDHEKGIDYLTYQFDQQGAWQIDLVEWSTPDKLMASHEFLTVFNRCMARLPKRMSELLFLRSITRVKTAECCELLGFESENQLWVTLSRTRIKLRECLNTYWFERE